MFKAGDAVEYRGPRKEYFGKQFTILRVNITDGSFYDYAELVESRGFIPHLKT